MSDFNTMAQDPFIQSLAIQSLTTVMGELFTALACVGAEAVLSSEFCKANIPSNLDIVRGVCSFGFSVTAVVYGSGCVMHSFNILSNQCLVDGHWPKNDSTYKAILNNFNAESVTAGNNIASTQTFSPVYAVLLEASKSCDGKVRDLYQKNPVKLIEILKKGVDLRLKLVDQTLTDPKAMEAYKKPINICNLS
jgi:hypothetical protein